jgi:site-specific recombinase XerD
MTIGPIIKGTAGAAANGQAEHPLFAEYRNQRAANTLIRQQSDLQRFAEYLATMNIATTADALATDPEAWRGMTWKLLAGFVEWQLRTGFAVASCNVRLSTVRTYATLAFQAGVIDAAEYRSIKAVNGYGDKEQRRIDEARDVKRVSTKKAAAVSLTDEQMKALLSSHPDTPQGRRNRLMMCLLLNLGLRVGEVVSLRASDFDLDSGTVTLYRPQVGKTQRCNLISSLWDAARAYIAQDVTDPQAPLLRASMRGGSLSASNMGLTRFGVAKRVQKLGRMVGVENLSPHDLRHSWALRTARNKADLIALRDAGGWTSVATPVRYVEAANVEIKPGV